MSSSQLLPARTEMGAVTLWVANRDGSIAYYRDGLRFYGEEVKTHDNEVRIEDPWGNLLRIRASRK